MLFQKLYIKISISILISFVIILIGIYYRDIYENLSKVLILLGILIAFFSIITGCYLEEIYCNNKKYIEEILMYRKGYTYEVRLPENITEDKLFRKFADKKNDKRVKLLFGK